MVATGMSQRRIAESLGISQSAVSQQLRQSHALGDVHPRDLVEAAAPVLRAIAAENGYRRLAVFGSVARGESRRDSDIDLIVDAPSETSTFDFLRFRHLIERALDRDVDLIEYGGLSLPLDDDILRDAVLL